MIKVVATLLVGMGLVVVGTGCENKPDATAKPAAAEGAKAAAQPAAAGGDSIGVKECDDYLAKFKMCVSKTPDVGKAAMQQAYDANLQMWKQLAAEPATKGTLPSTCKQAFDALAQNPNCK
jgi:hypothetical protein